MKTDGSLGESRRLICHKRAGDSGTRRRPGGKIYHATKRPALADPEGIRGSTEPPLEVFFGLLLTNRTSLDKVLDLLQGPV